jgi:hypothetical protein
MADHFWDADPDLRAEGETERKRHQESKPPGGNGATAWTMPDADFVRRHAALEFWLERELPPLDPLLGELFTTTSRLLISGPTGRGKSMIMLPIGMAIADGRDFLHWHGSGKPHRTLYLDGEMSRRLLKRRLADAVRRHGSTPATFHAFSREDFEDMPPLDTEAGQQYIDAAIAALGGVDLLILDNIQALTSGDLRDPESWRRVQPWVRRLTARHIGQVWVHHTGHNGEHSYGDKTREWALDTVALLKDVESDADVAFLLDFPKARERSPENRADFAPVTITLAEDEWTAEGAEVPKGKVRQSGKSSEPSPLARKYLSALWDALAAPSAAIHRPAGRNAVTLDAWRGECRRLGLLDDEKPDSERSLFSKYRRELIAADKVVVNGELVWPI